MNVLPPPLALSTPTQNLVRLTIMRGISWTSFLIVVIFGIEVLGFHLEVLLTILTIIGMAVINVATWWRLGRAHPVTNIEYASHLLLDIIGATLLFALTGGANNPAITCLLVPIIIAAATSNWKVVVVISASAISAYLILMVYYIPVPELSSHLPGMPFNLHLMGMAITFLLNSVLVAFFISKMALAIRHRERILSHTRETALRNEQILAVASQAAGTAHELGTPLSTISVIIGDMRSDLERQQQPELLQDLQLIKQQVDTCKTHLRALAANAQRKAGSIQRVEADTWFKEVINRWLVMRHDIDYEVTIKEGRAPLLEVDTTLDQAIMNLLNNAADADPNNIQLSLEWEQEFTLFAIRDHGKGVPLDIADQLGETFVSDRSKGMGIGLFLTHSTLDRFGGSVRLYNHQDGGTLTEVRLPNAGN